MDLDYYRPQLADQQTEDCESSPDNSIVRLSVRSEVCFPRTSRPRDPLRSKSKLMEVCQYQVKH